MKDRSTRLCRRAHLSSGQPYRAGPKAGEDTPQRDPKVQTLGDQTKRDFGGSFRARFDSFRPSPTGLST